MDNMKDLRLLVDVARLGSFAEVARLRDVDPSWVSRLVASMEAELGFRVFQRSTRSIAPTEPGAIYIRRIEALLDELKQAREDATALSSDLRGTLRMTTSISLGQEVLLPLLPKFRAAFPKLGLDLVLTDKNLDLVAERIDLAVRLVAEVAGDLVVTRLARTAYRVCASREYVERHGIPASPAALSERSCLLVDLPGYRSRSRWMFRDASGRVEEVPVRGEVQFSSCLTAYGAVMRGLDPALLPNWMIDDDVRAGRLVDLFPKFEVAATSFDTALWLIYPTRSYLPQKVRTMIDFLKSEFSARAGDVPEEAGQTRSR